MRTLVSAALMVALAGASQAAIPLLNATCGDGVDVHADQGGPVYINGKVAKLKKSNDNYYEAHHGDVTISIAISDDGTPSLSATWKGGANGVCTLTTDEVQKQGECPVDVSEADRANYPACN